jgi:hypothetical protein
MRIKKKRGDGSTGIGNAYVVLYHMSFLQTIYYESQGSSIFQQDCVPTFPMQNKQTEQKQNMKVR